MNRSDFIKATTAAAVATQVGTSSAAEGKQPVAFVNNRSGRPLQLVHCRWESTYEFDPASTALLVIDMQEDFFTEDLGESVAAIHAIVPRVVALVDVARRLRCRVIHTREGYDPDLSDVTPYRRFLDYVVWPGPLGRFLIPGEPGHDFLDELRPHPNETVIDKSGFSPFYTTELDAQLRAADVDHLILCGVTTECCVHSTLREAVDRSYWCLTVADCCATYEPDLQEAALSLIAGEGHLFGWVCDLADVKEGATALRSQ